MICRKTIDKNQTKHWFFEKISKIYKPLARPRKEEKLKLENQE